MPVDKSIESIIRFPNNFEICYASSESHQIGLNIWAFILDESNFRQGVGNGVAEEYNEVTQLYQQLTDRLTSRYSTPDGVNALSILISSGILSIFFYRKEKGSYKSRP